MATALAGIGIGEAVGWPFLREPLARHAASHLGVDVSIDAPFRIRFIFRPGLQAERLQVGAAREVEVPHLLLAEDIALRWRLSEALAFARGGPLVLRSLTARTLDARLVRDERGHASWDWARARDRSDPRPDPRITRIVVGEGQLLWRDAVQRTDLQASFHGQEGLRRRPGADQRPSPVGSGTSAPGEQRAAPGPSDPVTKEGFTIAVTGQWQGRELRADAWAAASLPLVASEADSAPVALRIDSRVGAAKLHFEGRASALLGDRDLDGALRLSGPSLAAVGDAIGVTLPRTPAFTLHGTLSHRQGIWGLGVDRADIGSSQLGGTFRLDTRRKPSQLDGRLTGQKLLLADLAPTVGAGTPASARRAGKVLPDQAFDLPSLRAIHADVKVAIETLDFGTAALRDMRQLATSLKLRDGVLSLDELSAVVAGGRLAGRMALDGRVSPATWTAKMSLVNVDIVQWIDALKKSPAAPGAPGGTAGAPGAAQQPRDRYYVTGKLAAEIDTTGRGRSTAEILGSLQGRVVARLHDGTLSHLVTELVGLDLAQSLGVAIRGDDALPLRCAWVNFAAQDGVLRVKHAVMDNADSTLTATGAISLRDESMALVARSRPKDLSPLSLRTPLSVTGPLSAPQVSVQSERLLPKLLAAAAVGGLLGPAAGMLPLIDLGADSGSDPCSEAGAREAPAGSALKPGAEEPVRATRSR